MASQMSDNGNTTTTTPTQTNNTLMSYGGIGGGVTSSSSSTIFSSSTVNTTQETDMLPELKPPTKKTLNLEDIEKLPYEIHRYSSFSTNYVPENILVDCPTDQSSRWSAFNNNPPQYLTLKLRRPAIVRKIKFGKFEKSHVCNIKKFRIYGGLDEERMVLLLEGGLRNDHIPETFSLRSEITSNLPIMYLKIVPLLSWGPTFNYSIWFIELLGQDDPMYTSVCLRDYNKLREMEIIRLCLKHFRQQGYESAFKALQEQTHVRLEHPLITELHQCLVVNGDFDKAEKFISDCVDEGLMDDYLNRQDYKHAWRLQHAQGSKQPGNRGGHQLVMDSQKRLIYLYGGWNGFQDLSDLWVFDIRNNCWTQLFEHTEQYNGPTPRSCHKMVFDPVSKNIFMLGRYLDNSIRTTEYIKSDFFLYDTRARTWLQICDDTSQVGGPQLMYDHQMCIDVDKRTIYVFGGKILTPRSVSASTSSEPEYSGLFSYHIATNTWNQILVDCHHPTASQPEVLSIKSRITHCMVFHNKKRKLYIYGGQRGKEDIHDFITYDVDNQSLEFLNRNSNGGQTAGTITSAAAGGSNANSATNNDGKSEPSPVALRATIDCERNEIYIFSSLSKIKDRRDVPNTPDASNSFWVYSLDTHTWSRIYSCRYNYTNSTATDDVHNKDNMLEPCPRYAHQLVYDEVAKLHYLFGGNPGRSTTPQLRLDDFWILELEKPKRDEILRHCRFLLRKLHYEEMAKSDPYKAMQFLRQHIAEVIDHNNKEQLKNFHKLASLLFKIDDDVEMEQPNLDTLPIGAGKSLAESSSDITSSSTNEEDIYTKSADAASDHTQATEDLSMESCESSTTSSGISDAASSYTAYRKSGGKRSRNDFIYDLRSRRSFLFNKLVQLMPSNMVQPERNLSDFATI
ncbi:muskelin isoform X1 [Lucilia sericata]|uniref:muskelin isoform X1 n=1 Tax=Lucilia sericata TaxID=13632 RepID=UPI0018A87EFD|nr:muskelin isoform X1 [Lucilia sericata]